MTDLLTRPVSQAGRQPRLRRGTHRSLVLGAALSAAWVAVMTLALVTVVTMAAWATASAKGDAAAALRAAGGFWLLAQHATVRPASVPITLPPLGVTALVGVLLHRRGLALARYLDIACFRSAWLATGAVGASYALVVAVVAGGVRGGGWQVDPVPALCSGWVLAVLASGSGVLRHAALRDRLRQLLPHRVRVVAVAAALATALVTAFAALGAAVVVGAHASDVATVARALHPGVVGGAALTLLQVAYVPDAVGWAIGYAVGPGFAVGAGTTVSAGHTLGGPVPAVPLLAALPGPAPGWVLPLLVILVTGAGAVAGVVAARRLRQRGRDWHAVALAAAGGLAAAAVLAVVALLCSGAIGPGRLAGVGPDAARVLGCAGLELAGGAAVGASLVVWAPRLPLRARRS